MGYTVTGIDIIYLFITGVLLITYVCSSKNIPFKELVSIGIILRLGLLVCDLYHLFPIPNLGADSEVFHHIAYNNVLYGSDGKLTNYTDFLTLVYTYTGHSRMIGQLINVIFGLGVILIGQKCLLLFDVNRKYMHIGTLILCLSPNLIIFSGGLLREAWCEFFITASIYQFLRWFKYGNVSNFLFSCMMVLAASYMHSGSIGVIAGYMIVYVLYNRNKNQFRFTFRSVFASLIVIAFSVFYLQNMDTFGQKMEGMDNENTEEVFISHYNSAQGGGSDYLTNLPVNSMSGAILYSPLKMIYFTFSPMPWDWRGFPDLLAFLIDSIIYLILCWGMIKNVNNNYIKLRIGLIVSLLSVVFIFGIGVTNAGTAMRHRAKLLPLFVVTYCISKTDTRKYIDNEDGLCNRSNLQS